MVDIIFSQQAGEFYIENILRGNAVENKIKRLAAENKFSNEASLAA